jgi:hypothetical protein
VFGHSKDQNSGLAADMPAAVQNAAIVGTRRISFSYFSKAGCPIVCAAPSPLTAK